MICQCYVINLHVFHQSPGSTAHQLQQRFNTIKDTRWVVKDTHLACVLTQDACSVSQTHHLLCKLVNHRFTPTWKSWLCFISQNNWNCTCSRWYLLHSTIYCTYWNHVIWLIMNEGSHLNPDRRNSNFDEYMVEIIHCQCFQWEYYAIVSMVCESETRTWLDCFVTIAVTKQHN